MACKRLIEVFFAKLRQKAFKPYSNFPPCHIMPKRQAVISQ